MILLPLKPNKKTPAAGEDQELWMEQLEVKAAVQTTSGSEFLSWKQYCKVPLEVHFLSLRFCACQKHFVKFEQFKNAQKYRNTISNAAWPQRASANTPSP